MLKNPKSRRGAAERAAQWYVHEVHFCVISRKAIRTKWQKVDFFACDVVGKAPSGKHVYVQVTTGQSSAVSVRRRKLEQIPWHPTDAVDLIQLIHTLDPNDARKKRWWFKVHRYEPTANGSRRWVTDDELVPVPSSWFKTRSEE